LATALEPRTRSTVAREPPIDRLALHPKILDAHLSTPRHGRVVGAQRAEAMPDEYTDVPRAANAARGIWHVPAVLSEVAAKAKTSAGLGRRARASLARDGRQGALFLLFGSTSSGASHFDRFKIYGFP
jgi:hypothetical protein